MASILAGRSTAQSKQSDLTVAMHVATISEGKLISGVCLNVHVCNAMKQPCMIAPVRESVRGDIHEPQINSMGGVYLTERSKTVFCSITHLLNQSSYEPASFCRADNSPCLSVETKVLGSARSATHSSGVRALICHNLWCVCVCVCSIPLPVFKVLH